MELVLQIAEYRNERIRVTKNLFGVDSVMFTKLDDLKYAIDFCNIGTYEAFYGTEESDE